MDNKIQSLLDIISPRVTGFQVYQTLTYPGYKGGNGVWDTLSAWAQNALVEGDHGVVETESGVIRKGYLKDEKRKVSIERLVTWDSSCVLKPHQYSFRMSTSYSIKDTDSLATSRAEFEKRAQQITIGQNPLGLERSEETYISFVEMGARFPIFASWWYTAQAGSNERGKAKITVWMKEPILTLDRIYALLPYGWGVSGILNNESYDFWSVIEPVYSRAKQADKQPIFCRVGGN